MASTLRLPPELEADARARCERLGISLNALVCVALDAYLAGPKPPVEQPPESAEAASQPADRGGAGPGPAPVVVPVVGAAPVDPGRRNLTKAQRKALAQRNQRR